MIEIGRSFADFWELKKFKLNFSFKDLLRIPKGKLKWIFVENGGGVVGCIGGSQEIENHKEGFKLMYSHVSRLISHTVLAH